MQNASGSGRGSQSDVFAAFARAFRLKDAPPAIRSYAKCLVLDLLGCAIGALDSPEAQSASAACRALGGSPGRSALWGTGIGAAAGTAALFNGTVAHVLELDDFLGIDHTGAVVLPALFAVMDDTGTHDEDRFLEAMIVSYEIGRRMLDKAGGYRAHNGSGWHTTGTLGSIAAAVAIAKYLKLDHDQMVSAIGLAGSFTGGTWAFHRDGAMSKRFHCGKAAEAGITAAYFARQGFTGPAHIIDAQWGGYFALHAPDHCVDMDSLFADLGEDLRIGWTGIKPYACCRGNHSVIDSIFKIKARTSLDPDRIKSISVECSSTQLRQLGNRNPQSIVEAQLSLPFAVATAIRFNDVDITRYSAAAIRNRATLQLCNRVEMTEGNDWPDAAEPRLTVAMADGAQFRQQVQVARGDPRNPMTPSEVVNKFVGLVQHRLTADQMQILTDFGLDRGGSLAKVGQVLSSKLEVLANNNI
ncbi:MAG: MmgE/PrpD family protein [Alphaproteobacteria bacterium]|nr:MmgE/PrpD family protein [Alphaproteobacteria bacterium]